MFSLLTRILYLSYLRWPTFLCNFNVWIRIWTTVFRGECWLKASQAGHSSIYKREVTFASSWEKNRGIASVQIHVEEDYGVAVAQVYHFRRNNSIRFSCFKPKWIPLYTDPDDRIVRVCSALVSLFPPNSCPFSVAFDQICCIKSQKISMLPQRAFFFFYPRY